MSVATPPPTLSPPPARGDRAGWGPGVARLAWFGLPAAATLLLALTGGGIEDGDWYPWAFVTTLGCGMLYALDVLRPRRGAGGAAALAFVGLALWAVLSTSWALLPGAAFAEGARTTFYAASFAIVLASVRQRRDAAALFSLLAAVCGGLALFAVIRIALGPPASWIVYERFAWPTGYPNTAASLAVLAVWLCAGIAADRGVLWPVRAAAQGGSVLAAGLVVLSQSRGAVYALLIATPLVLLIVRERVRLLVPLAVTAVALLPAVPALRATIEADVAPPIQHAGRLLLLCGALGVLAGALVALADRRIDLSDAARARVGRVLLAVTAVLVACGLVAGLALGAPHRVRTAWDTFSQTDRSSAGPHLLSFESNRYDLWRVALDEGARHPLRGDGAASFGIPYLRHGLSAETPAQAHGEVFELVSTLGLPGLLLGAAVGLTGLAGLSGRVPGSIRRPGGDPVLAGAFGAALAVLVHAQADWHWESAAVAVPLVAVLAGGAALLARPGTWSALVTRLCGAALVALALLWILPGLLATRVEQQAVTNASSGSAHLAARLDPFAAAPLLEAASLEGGSGRRTEALRDARDATTREPHNWATWIALARLQTGAARQRACDRARNENPRLRRCP